VTAGHPTAYPERPVTCKMRCFGRARERGIWRHHDGRRQAPWLVCGCGVPAAPFNTANGRPHSGRNRPRPDRKPSQRIFSHDRSIRVIMTGTPRRVAKQFVEMGLRALLVPARFRLHRQRAFVVAYHNVVPNQWGRLGDRSLHLPVGEFAAQLDFLEQKCDVVPLRALLGSQTAPSDRIRVAITFDDAYRGACVLGGGELARRRLPATVFITPGFVGDGAFWWDELASPDAGLAAELRTAALDELAGDDAAIRAWAAAAGRPTYPAPSEARVASLDEIVAMSQTGLVTFGAHTWSHPDLTRVDDQRLAVELTRPVQWLRDRFGPIAVPFLAYPYGHFDQRVASAAAAAGYEAALAIEGGWLPPQLERRFALPRINIPAGASRDNFALRASGLL
jgi:peptidoglycan/xylan/chitin deacetylase (PgdA/CDA1 family)